MTCERITLPDGTAMIVCMRGRRTRRCACGRVAEYLCDAPRGPRSKRTCDQPLCDACRTVASPDRDLCRVHAALEASRAAAPSKLTAAPPSAAQLDLFNATASTRSPR